MTTADPDNDRPQQGSSADDGTPDIMKESFKRETTKAKQEKEEKEMEESRRSMMGAPMDPNSPTTKLNFPPGIDSQDMFDPGRSTPGAPPVDDRSGTMSRADDSPARGSPTDERIEKDKEGK